ncbi:hypothetical protein PROFUN_14931 [Planoprotostelium fungivorum]|uniref:BRCT domain-containing protein n=1 Tax=Planoprotostelium fungivorum TaxID=1890364 RepID=A0A2P6MYE6_9EUKA|nr:hypothetical protein PROFUN_14931 [Planoprotostelium fungivorum]
MPPGGSKQTKKTSESSARKRRISVEPVEHQSAKRPRNQESEKTTESAEPQIAEQFISSGVDDVPEFLRQLSEKPAAAQKIKVVDIPAGTRKLTGRNYVVAGIPSWAVPTEVGEDQIIKKLGGLYSIMPTSTVTHVLVAKNASQNKSKKLVLEDESTFFEHIQVISQSNSSQATRSLPTSATPVADVPTPKEKEDQLLTDKYKPKTTKDLIGAPPVAAIASWLAQWKNGPPEKRAALLSGPPGIGKTSAALLVAVEQGYEPVEFNASDARSKNMLKDQVREITQSRTLTSFFKTEKKKALLVDGMSSGDIGGMVELTNMIKSTSIPIICICNDRSSPKVKTLSNYCLDVKFKRPMIHQMLNRFRQIAQSEGLPVENLLLERMLESAHGDMRAALNLLHLCKNSSQTKGKLTSSTTFLNSVRDVDIGPFDAARKLLDNTGALSVDDRLALCQTDSSLIPLLIQESYTARVPTSHRVTRVSKFKGQARGVLTGLQSCFMISDMISESDAIEKMIRVGQHWELSNAHAICSSLLPANILQGGTYSNLSFPRYTNGLTVMLTQHSFLGKMSSQNKSNRILKEIHRTMNLVVSSNSLESRLDYLPLLKQKLTVPLISQHTAAVAEVLDLMEIYGLSREDWESIAKLTDLNGGDSLKLIPGITKSALTRQWQVLRHPKAQRMIQKWTKMRSLSKLVRDIAKLWGSFQRLKLAGSSNNEKNDKKCKSGEAAKKIIRRNSRRQTTCFTDEDAPQSSARCSMLASVESSAKRQVLTAQKRMELLQRGLNLSVTKKLKEARERNKRLEKELNASVKERDKAVRQMHQQERHLSLSKSHNQVKTPTKKFDNTQSEIDKLKQQLIESRKRQEEVDTDNSSLQREIRVMTEALALKRLSNEYAEKGTEEDLKVSLTSLVREETAQLNVELKAKVELLAQSEQRIVRLRTDIDEASSTEISLSEKITHLEESFQDASEALIKQEQVIQTLERENIKLNQLIHDETEGEKMMRDKEISKQMEGLIDRLNAVEEENVLLRRDADKSYRMESVIRQMREENERGESERYSILERERDLTDKLNDVHVQMNQLTTNHKTLKLSLKQAVESKTRADEQISFLEGENVALLSHQSGHEEELQERVDHYMTEVKELLDEKEQTMYQKAQWKTEIEHAQEIIKELESQLRSYTDSAIQSRRTLEKSLLVIDGLELELTEREMNDIYQVNELEQENAIQSRRTLEKSLLVIDGLELELTEREMNDIYQVNELEQEKSKWKSLHQAEKKRSLHMLDTLQRAKDKFELLDEHIVEDTLSALCRLLGDFCTLHLTCSIYHLIEAAPVLAKGLRFKRGHQRNALLQES